MGQQASQGAIGGCAVVTLEREADVAAAIGVLPLRLHDAIETDACVRKGMAESTGGAGFVRHVSHAHLGLIPVQGHTTHFWFALAAGQGIEADQSAVEFERFLGGLQGLRTGGCLDYAAHLHFAGGD